MPSQLISKWCEPSKGNYVKGLTIKGSGRWFGLVMVIVLKELTTVEVRAKLINLIRVL